MRNYGQIKRTVKIKKRYTLSPNVLNLTDEAKKWSELEKRLRGEINEIIWDIVTESVSLGIDSRPGDLREKKMQVADQAKASILDWVERVMMSKCASALCQLNAYLGKYCEYHTNHKESIL